MACVTLKSCFLLATLLTAAVTGSDEVVRRVGITATGRVAASSEASTASHAATGAFIEVSSRAKSHVGLTFWHSLRKQLEARKEHLDTTGLRSSESRDAKSSSQDAMWKAVFEVDNRFHNKLPCGFHENIAYPSTLVPTFIKRGVESARACSLMCAADPLGERSGRGAPCQSFMYNSGLSECKFFSSGQPAKALWKSTPGTTSGPPCNLEGFRQEIQKSFEADIKQAVKAEKELSQQLQNVNGQLTQEKKYAEALASTLKKEKDDNSVLKNEIVRSEKKGTAPASAVPKAVAKAATPPKAAAEPFTPPKAAAQPATQPKAAERKHVNAAGDLKHNSSEQLKDWISSHPHDLKNVNAAGDLKHNSSEQLKDWISSHPQAEKHVQPVQRVQGVPPPAPVQPMRKPTPDDVSKTTPATGTTAEENAKGWFQKSWALCAVGFIVLLAIVTRLNIYIKGRDGKGNEKHKPSNDALTGLTGALGSLKD